MMRRSDWQVLLQRGPVKTHYMPGSSTAIQKESLMAQISSRCLRTGSAVAGGNFDVGRFLHGEDSRLDVKYLVVVEQKGGTYGSIL